MMGAKKEMAAGAAAIAAPITAKTGRRAGLVLLLAVLLSASCDLFTYGQLGGADKTDTFMPGSPDFEAIMADMRGVWYSHYAGIGRLDGYRIGKITDFKEMVEDSGKQSLFPKAEKPYKTYTSESGSDKPADDDYFVLYDDTVYGQSDGGEGGNVSWGFAFMGIVRAVNVFNGNRRRGAVIIEYLEGCAPNWQNASGDEIKDGKLPFFGIYYRVLSPDIVQMANAVDLAALYRGEKYHTEKQHLTEAIEVNSVENEAEFIAWGIVIPQDRE
ncbi:MAG: hypothetical protein LBD86_05260 [Spirochaetaceae bacterium]|jgi:hypothetical protein|nr:hypothetical protein [Spirochaetaceae bacterium]